MLKKIQTPRKRAVFGAPTRSQLPAPVTETDAALLDSASLLTPLTPKNVAFKDGFK
jgi:hypothetical protein